MSLEIEYKIVTYDTSEECVREMKGIFNLVAAWAVAMNYTQRAVEEYREALVRGIADKTFFVAKLAGQAVAFLAMKKVRNIIQGRIGLSEDGIFVHPLHREKGISKRLFKLAEEKAIEDKYDYIYFSPSTDGGSMDVVVSTLINSGYMIQMYGLYKEVNHG